MGVRMWFHQGRDMLFFKNMLYTFGVYCMYILLVYCLYIACLLFVYNHLLPYIVIALFVYCQFIACVIFWEKNEYKLLWLVMPLYCFCIWLILGRYWPHIWLVLPTYCANRRTHKQINAKNSKNQLISGNKNAIGGYIVAILRQYEAYTVAIQKL